MSHPSALVLTYHAIEAGSSPLCLEPDLFRDQLDILVELGATTLTVSQLVAAVRTGELPRRAVAITFDDGCASAVRIAAPLLVERRQMATFFCVGGHLGGWNDWPTQPPGIPRLELATAPELADLARLGFEVGAHGMEHAPFRGLSGPELDRELRVSRTMLEQATGTQVRCLAYPYGVLPDATAARLVSEVYEAACAATLRRVTPDSDPFVLPRVDAHYLRRRATFRRVASGRFDAYLRARRLARSARRRS